METDMHIEFGNPRGVRARVTKSLKDKIRSALEWSARAEEAATAASTRGLWPESACVARM